MDPVEKYARAADFVAMFLGVDPKYVFRVAMANDDDEEVVGIIQTYLEGGPLPQDSSSQSSDADDPIIRCRPLVQPLDPEPALTGMDELKPVTCCVCGCLVYHRF